MRLGLAGYERQRGVWGARGFLVGEVDFGNHLSLSRRHGLDGLALSGLVGFQFQITPDPGRHSTASPCRLALG